MTRGRWITAVVVAIGFAGGVFLLDRLGMKGLHWRPWSRAIVHGGDPIPEPALGEFVRVGSPETFQTFGRDGTTYLFSGAAGSTWLLLRDGRGSAAGYVARDVVAYQLSVRYPFGVSFHSEVAPCGGTADFEGGAWTLGFTSPACSAANGTWLRRARPSEVQQDDRTCLRYHACACDLAGALPALFAQSCEQTRALIGVAPDDPDSCRAGLSLARSLASRSGVALPSSCEER